MKRVLMVQSGGHTLTVKQSLAYGKLVMALQTRNDWIVKVSAMPEPLDIYDIVVALPANDHYSDNPHSNVWKTYHEAELSGKETYMIFRDGSILGQTGGRT
jgi:hypothetical protein